MSARRVPMTDVENNSGAQWIPDLSESAATALSEASISWLRRAAKASARNAMKEASARHYSAANYR